MVAELIAQRASRSHGSDALAERDAAGTGPAAATDGGNPTAAHAQQEQAQAQMQQQQQQQAATMCAPNCDSRNGETVSASAVDHGRVR